MTDLGKPTLSVTIIWADDTPALTYINVTELTGHLDWRGGCDLHLYQHDITHKPTSIKLTILTNEHVGHFSVQATPPSTPSDP
jgi:hypothetical protein